jgi:hypothetical protein
MAKFVTTYGKTWHTWQVKGLYRLIDRFEPDALSWAGKAIESRSDVLMRGSPGPHLILSCEMVCSMARLERLFSAHIHTTSLVPS